MTIPQEATREQIHWSLPVHEAPMMNILYTAAGRVAALIGLALLLQACGPDQVPATSPVAPEPVTFRMAVDNLPDGLDPLKASDVYSNLAIKAVFETAWRYDPNLRPHRLIPGLAGGQPDISADGLHYTFSLRSDARFNDSAVFPDNKGRPVTAQDLVYSIKRHLRPGSGSYGAWLWEDHIEGVAEWRDAGGDLDAPLSGLTVADDGRIHIRLRAPYPHLQHSLATPFSAVVPREAIETLGADFARRPVGSGVFLAGSRDDVRWVFERASGASADPLPAGAGIAAFELHALPDPVARWRALRSGSIDLIEVPATHVAEAVQSIAPLTLEQELATTHRAALAAESGFVFIAINHRNPALGGMMATVLIVHACCVVRWSAHMTGRSAIARSIPAWVRRSPRCVRPYCRAPGTSHPSPRNPQSRWPCCSRVNGWAMHFQS